jgi:acetyltransferase-like isoleucine patch superfamily enzyme
MSNIHKSSQLYKVEIKGNVMIREFCTVHKSLLECNCKIYERVSIKRSRIGRGVDINTNTYIENAFIWEDVQIAPNCSIVGVTHNFSRHGVSHEDHFSQIELETGVWVGAGAIILPGVTVGSHSVIAAGSIVNMDIPAHHRYVGVPLNNNFRLEEIK